MYCPIKSNIILHHIWYGNLQLLTGNQLRWLTFNFNNLICIFTFIFYQIKSQTLLMIFWSYLNMILTRHLHTCCDPDTKYLIRAKMCVRVWRDKLGWRGWSSTEWWRGEREEERGGGALGLEVSLKWWNRSMSQRQTLMVREINWQTARRSLVSVMKCKLGCVIACVVTDWRADATSLHTSIALKTKCWAWVSIWVLEYICAFAKEPMKRSVLSFVCNYRAGRWPQRHQRLTILPSLPWENGSLSRLATASHKLHRTF